MYYVKMYVYGLCFIRLGLQENDDKRTNKINSSKEIKKGKIIVLKKSSSQQIRKKIYFLTHGVIY